MGPIDTKVFFASGRDKAMVFAHFKDFFRSSQLKSSSMMPHEMVVNGASINLPTHYEVLNLPRTAHAGSNLSPHYLKTAYRRALLQHHPDKLQAPIKSKNSQAGPDITQTKPGFTIDEITEAYAVLSVPKLRSEYDRELKIKSHSEKNARQGENDEFRTGYETLDLDDLAYDGNEEIWFKRCRCGDQQGFLIREADLEEASDVGELLVGCRGCSLWLRVLFGVFKDDHHG
jgi:diphthamide biosynthesis protein 4